jgi:mRNA interferase RelE/StbE
MDAKERKRIRSFLEDKLSLHDDPRKLGKSLKGQDSELWRYRVGDYRIICDIRDDALVVLVVKVGHRKEVYRSH